MASSKFEPGDRVVAYDHKGQKHGKGVVVPSQDKRLLDYVKVRLDGSQLDIYFADVNVKRLIKKVRHIVRPETRTKKTVKRSRR